MSTHRRPLRVVVILLASATIAACGISDPARTGVWVVSRPSLSDTAMARSSEPFVVAVRDSRGGYTTPASVVVTSGPAPGADDPLPEAVKIAGAANEEGAFFAIIPLETDGRARFWVQRGRKAGRATITVEAFDVKGTIELTIEPARAAKFRAEPADTVVFVGASYNLRATVTDQWGNDRPDPVQRTAGPGLTVSTTGTVTAREIGRRAVQLTSGNVTGQAWVSVPPIGTLAAISGPTYGESIVVLNLDGSDWRTVGVPLSTYSQRTAPQWSPDGQELVYHNVSGDVDVVSYRIAPAGSARRLFGADAPPSQIFPRFSRDGQWLFFSGGPNVRTVSIWRARADGTSPARVGPPVFEPHYSADPSPSPDGTRVVYLQEQVVGTITAPVIRVLNVVTGAVTPLDILGSSPRWSPTADRIAYVDYSGRVVLIDPDGGNSRVLSAPGRTYIAGLDWSPDGRWLVVRSG
jgi:hypothetical protein